MKPSNQTRVSTHKQSSPSYAEFVAQSRRVLGLPEKSAPTGRLNPSLNGLMNEAFSRAEASRRRKTT